MEHGGSMVADAKKREEPCFMLVNVNVTLNTKTKIAYNSRRFELDVEQDRAIIIHIFII